MNWNTAMSAAHRCWAEVDLDVLRENLGWIRQSLRPNVRLMTVVKADAYGHGLKPIAALLMQSGTDIFGVANLIEARAIRSVGRGWPILMLGACLPWEVEEAVRDHVQPTLSSIEEAQAFSAAGVRQERTVAVHLKLDTGMGRLGADPDQIVSLTRTIQELPRLSVAGVYTHLAAAEDDELFTRRQLDLFQASLAQLEQHGFRIPCVHAANSAGLLHEPKAQFDLVRPGLLVYGVVPPGRRVLPDGSRCRVRPALAWKCRVGLVKEVAAGTRLSYGGSYVTSGRLRIATLTAGYGDGYMRAGSNRALILIHGHRCPVIGRITMDQTLVDCSRAPEARAGDEAVLIGPQGPDQITVTELAEWTGTIPWEVLTNITYRVPRIYRGGSAA